MTALSASYEAERQDGLMVSVPVKGSTIVYKGGLIVDKGTGYAEPGVDGSGYIFLGVAAETVDNSSGSDGDLSVRVEKTGSYKYALSGGATQTNLTNLVYIHDDNTVGTSSSNSVACGYVVAVVDTTYVKVRIDLKAI